MTLDQNQKVDSEVIDLLKALGRAYLQNNEYQKATDKFSQLFSSGVNDPEVTSCYALSLAGMDSIDSEALSIYSQAFSENTNDETLALTLATLFLKHEATQEPVLQVYRKALTYEPPFANEIRHALEKVFQETTETLTLPEIKQTLLECADNPDMLALYLNISWHEHKYDETLDVLDALYSETGKSDYLGAIYTTLLEKRSYTEAQRRKFMLSARDVQHALKYRQLDQRLTRISDIEPYLDHRYLLAGIESPNKSGPAADDEYELFLLDRDLDQLDDATSTSRVLVEVDPTFDLQRDFIERMAQSSSSLQNNDGSNGAEHPAYNTIAIFQILNYSEDIAEALHFTTFTQIIAGELIRRQQSRHHVLKDGLIVLDAAPAEILKIALDTHRKLERYNQVVEAEEVIRLRISIHSTSTPFLKLPHDGLAELRKGIKIQNLPNHPLRGDGDTPYRQESDSTLLTSESAAVMAGSRELKELGLFDLPYSSKQMKIFEIEAKAAITDTKAAPAHRERSHFGKYAVTETLTTTDIKATYRGYDPQLQRSVIIKAFRKNAFLISGEPNQITETFFTDVRHANRINHPNIGVIYDAGEEDDLLYIVREYIEGQTLREYLYSLSRPDLRLALKVFAKIVEVLQRYHSQNVCHKNLKPNNIYITSQDELKLLDGGLTSLRHRDDIWDIDLTASAYAAPEQIQGVRLGLQCDIFLLATLLYEALTGMHPFLADTAADTRMRILGDMPHPPATLYGDLPPELDSLILTALEKKPEERQMSLENFQRVLNGDSGNPAERKLFEIFK